MDAHRIVINGVTYGNVGKIETEIEREYYHNVTSLSGRKYQDVRYTKENQKVQFFNLLNGVYTSLIDFVKAHKGTPINCGFPDDDNGFIFADYYISITKPSLMKGYLNGKYYKNGVELYFEAVNADE